MAATRSSRLAAGRADGAALARPQERAREATLRTLRTVAGPVRPGRKTKLLVKHLVPGDIALVDHLDIGRLSAEELIAAGASAVLNCSASTSGSYPNLGPQLLVEAGILLIDLPDDSLFGQLADGDAITVRAEDPPASGDRA